MIPILLRKGKSRQRFLKRQDCLNLLLSLNLNK